MKNAYEIRGDEVAIFLNSKRYGQMETMISIDKLEKAKSYTKSWSVYFKSTTESFYCVGSDDTRLHRWILDAPRDMVVDHINHNTLDNRNNNLRIVSNSENQQNRKGAQTNSESGVRGVSWCKDTSMWRAQIGIAGRAKFIGRFNTIEDADNAVKVARANYMPFSKEAFFDN